MSTAGSVEQGCTTWFGWRRALAGALSISALVVGVLGGIPAAASAEQGTRIFSATSSGASEPFRVPAGIHWLTIDAQGGHGGQFHNDSTAAGGLAGGMSAVVPVTPGDMLAVQVGKFGGYDGGHGWARGGAHGTSPGSSSGHSAAGGGGASAVADAHGAPVVVAGGGGGGGGDDDNDAWGGKGGDGGNPPRGGFPGLDESVHEPSDTAVGGCGGCARRPDGEGGADGDDGTLHGGAGGGGGGGYGGGGGGAVDAGDYNSVGGGGGGGGSSYAVSGALDVHAYPSPRACPRENGPQCDGRIVLSWGEPPATIVPTAGEDQDAIITQDFVPPAVRVTAAGGVPASGVRVTFSTPSASASGYFPGFVTTWTATTGVDGTAEVPRLVANGVAGRWTAEARVDGVALPARFTLRNDPSTTTLALASSVTPSSSGQPVRFLATVGSPARFDDARPSGRVEFVVDGAPLGDPVVLDQATGTATSAPVPSSGTPALTAGTHQVLATYLGDDSHGQSSRTIVQQVTRAPTGLTLTSAPSPSDAGEDVILTATIDVRAPGAAEPTGSVAFELQDGTALGSAPLDGDGVARLTTNTLPLGQVELVARFAGDDEHAPSSGRTIQSVGAGATATLLSSSVSPPVTGEPISLTAVVRRATPGTAPVGTVTFTRDGDEICPPAQLDGAGSATCALPAGLAAGAHAVRADFAPIVGSPDTASSGLLELTVAPAATETTIAVTPDPSSYGAVLTFEASVHALAPAVGTPGGAVQFFLDGNAVGGPVAVADGSARIVAACALTGVCGPAPGPHVVEARYVDDAAPARFSASGATALHVVGPATTTTTLESGANPATVDSPVRFTARVGAGDGQPPPSGRVQFLRDGAPLGEPVALERGTAVSESDATLAVGAHEIAARYLGTAGYAESDGALVQQIQPVPPFDPPPPVDPPPPGGGSGGGGSGGGGGPAAPSAPPAGPAGPPPAAVATVETTRARVDPDGSFALTIRCAGTPGQRCVGQLSVRRPDRAGRGSTLATRRVSLPAGRTSGLDVDLTRGGGRLLARARSLSAVARVDATGAGAATAPAPTRTLRLRATSAPAIAVVLARHATATASRDGGLRLRLDCDARWKVWCEGSVALLGARGAPLGGRPLTLRAVGPTGVTVAIARRAWTRLRAADGASRRIAIRVRTRSTAPAGPPTVRERRVEVRLP